eukprot:m.50165 g.50165  ORF g.50165 m.50165 type:complete len:339 (-) comp15359_c0_seq2:14-1030(-)
MAERMFVLLPVLAFIHGACSQSTDQPFILESFDVSTDPHAVCMDGSRGGVYTAPASSDSSQLKYYVLYLEGGGWCYDEKSCLARCAGKPDNCQSPLATSKVWEGKQDLGGIFSTHPDESPLHSANKFYLRYCTGDAHMGSAGPTNTTHGWHFRGQHTVEASLRLMVTKYGLGSAPGHTLVFGGGSAGGRGAMVNLDFVPGILDALGAHGVRTMGFPDSPYWIDESPDRGATPPSTFVGFNVTTQGIFRMANITGRASAACSAVYRGDEAWKCALGQYRFPFISTPYLMVASQNDAFQLGMTVWTTWTESTVAIPVLCYSYNITCNFLSTREEIRHDVI